VTFHFVVVTTRRTDEVCIELAPVVFCLIVTTVEVVTCISNVIGETFDVVELGALFALNLCAVVDSVVRQEARDGFRVVLRDTRTLRFFD
jgi:hypothetical protein